MFNGLGASTVNNYFFKNILITGGCGFIGSHFIELLLARKDPIKIINLDKLTYAAVSKEMNKFWVRDNRYQFVCGDINDTVLVDNLYDRHIIDTVVHFAAESHVDSSIANPEKFITTNINGTFNLLETFRQYHTKKNTLNTARFHHVSTDEVYGSIPELLNPVKENTPYNPSSPYSASKASSDHLVQCYYTTYGLPISISHCTNNYGPRQHIEKLIPKTIKAFKENKAITLYGNGQQRRDWLYVKDHCAAILKILSLGKVGEKYNISANHELTNLTLIETIHTLMSTPSHTLKLPPFKDCVQFTKDRPGHDLRYALNHDKITKNCDWEPEVLLNNGLMLTIENYLIG